MKKEILVLLSVLATASFLFDDQFSLFINFDSAIFSFISVLSITLINQFTLPIISILITKKKQWKLVIPLFLALGFLFVLFKFIIVRPRPFEVLDIAKISGLDYGFASWNTSFPSWHIATLAMLIPFIEKDKIRIMILSALMVLVSFSRLYTGFHYLSDILFGFLIGYFFGYFLRKHSQKINFFKDS